MTLTPTRSVLLTAALLCLVAPAAVFAAGIPDTLPKADDPGGPPAWISEDALRAAMDAKGQPIGSRLESVGHLFDWWTFLKDELDQYAAKKSSRVAPDGSLISCEPLWRSWYNGEKAKSLAELVELSWDVVRVRVLDSKPGFLHGQPGELLDIEVLSVLKDTGKERVPRRGFYLFDNYTRMAIDGRALCLGERQIPHDEEFFLFQIWSDSSGTVGGLPLYAADSSALIFDDGTYLGSLLYYTVEAQDLAKQLPTLGEMLRAEPKSL